MSTAWRKCRQRTEQARVSEPWSSSDEESSSPRPSRRRRRDGGLIRKMVKKVVHPLSTSYVGVRYRAELDKYVTEIRPTKSTKKIWLGTYDTAEEAARAFDIGNLCCNKNLPLNFPDSSPRLLRRISSRLSPDQTRNAIAKLAKEVARVVTVSNAETHQSEPAGVTYTEVVPPSCEETQRVVVVEEFATSMPLNGEVDHHSLSFDFTQVFIDDERAHMPIHKLINFRKRSTATSHLSHAGSTRSVSLLIPILSRWRCPLVKQVRHKRQGKVDVQ